MRRGTPAAAAIAALILLADAAAAKAQERADPPPPPLDPSGTLGLSIENDILGGSDRYYTNGLQLAWRSASADLPAPLAWLDRRLDPLLGPGVLRWGLALGHNIYTPVDTLRRNPDPRDRPYAGYLYGAASLARVTGASLTLFELQLGLVGPSALGEEVQNNVHRLLNTDTYNGWDFQLKDEPVAAAIASRVWRAPLFRLGGGLEAEALPSATLGLGTVQTSLGGGAVLRIGQDLAMDFGPPRVRPAVAGSVFFQPQERLGWYVFAGAEGRAVARDILLDGNTWRDSRSVSRRPLVADVQAGLALAWRGMRLTYTHVWRMEEFHGQRGGLQQFGSLSLSVRF